MKRSKIVTKNVYFPGRAPFRLLAVLLCAGLCLSLFACGQKPTAPVVDPDVTYTQLLGDMNRQITASLAQDLPYADCWAAAGDCVLVCGEGGQDAAPVLAKLDLARETYALSALTLPDIPQDLDATRQAWAQKEQAADQADTADAADDPSQSDLSQETTIPMHEVVSILSQNEGQQIFLLLDDCLQRVVPAADGTPSLEIVERAVTLCEVDASGAAQPLVRLQLPTVYTALETIGKACFWGADQTLWVTATDVLQAQTHLLRFSLADGALLTALSLPQNETLYAGCFWPLPGDGLAVLAGAAAGQGAAANTFSVFVVEGLDGEAPTWADPIPLPDLPSTQTVLGAVPQLDAEQEKLLFATSSGIYSWDRVANTVQEQLSWAAFSVNSINLLAAFQLGDGRFVAALRSQGQENYQLRMLTPLDPAVVAQRQVITFGMQSYGISAAQNAIQDVINAFNATSQDYYVQVVDYTSEAAERQGLGYGNGAVLLARDVLDNNLPDILMAEELSDDLIEKGVLLDLYPFLEQDPELSKEDLLPGVLAACEHQGTLPSVLAAYTVLAVFGDAAVVGDTPGWTMEEYNALCAAYPDATPFFKMTRQDILQYLIFCDGQDFLDYENAQAHFDTPEFVELVRACEAYPTEIDYLHDMDPKPHLADRSTLLLPTRLEDWRAILGPRYALGEALTIKGYPTQGAHSGNLIQEQLCLGITISCQDPQAAWQLLRQFLLPAFQDKIGSDLGTMPGFPLRRDSLAVTAKAALSPRAAGISASPGYFTDEEWRSMDTSFFQQGITEDDIQALTQMLEGLDTVMRYDASVFNIVFEELDGYYNGIRTAEEAAQIIQNRVQTYLDE